MNCYKLKLINFNKGLLDNSIDATYIIHLKGNGRLKSIYNMLNEYQPTKKVYILFNKGYKKCKKPSYINCAALDLIDSFKTIFKDAQNKNYNNILVLEDDFTFLPDMKNEVVIKDINNFINSNVNKEFIYYLGCIPFLRIPNIDTSLLLFSGGTHACIYSKEFIKNINNNHENINNWDHYLNFNYFGKRYMHNKLLCYQLFPETENSKEWYMQNNKLNFLKLSNSGYPLLNLFKLNERYDIGYPFFYSLSIINLFIILIILYYILKFIFRFSNK